MRFASTFALIMLLSACATVPDAAFECDEPRPEVCTREFAPTCAVLAGGGRKEYASPCTACSDPQVKGYDKGGCPE